jgi:bacteriorhodopsin
MRTFLLAVPWILLPVSLLAQTPFVFQGQSIAPGTHQKFLIVTFCGDG